ncbi:winged helix-turn-helix domain-containing protein [Pseudoalteromonas sp. Of7M-16]|uniref:winged helix-turn-helix domain-containing protein n=1 Tax=Pseudoalteromonas sp. Of7M-16 TaxID=2917756 RepID=UPI001EF5854B|nr:winged helix-turn-helix domain-containing protein [Pseudoalteromonas sp. Of7M-16]MCG7551627.1 winged helix-turn-helix domain-containing protein [Pseudoalteromonas sp. Of7M-16]
MAHPRHTILDHFKVNDWAIDCKRLTATRAQTKVRLEPKAALILQYMAARPGEIIGREELFDTFWPNQVVTEDALNRVISTLRKTLNDSSTEPQYIATIRKSGYRLVADVKHIAPPLRHNRTKKLTGISIILCGLLLITALISSYSFQPQKPLKPRLNGEFKRLTYSTKVKLTPHLSEDASQLTYVELNKEATNTLVLMSVKSNTKTYYNSADTEFSFPVVAPQANSVLAVIKHLNKAQPYAIALIDFDKKAIKRLVELNSESLGLSHHIQSKSVVFTQRRVPFSTHQVTLFDPLYSSNKQLSSPPDGFSDRQPIFSPSGQKVAFIRTKAPTEHAIFTVNLDGQETQLTEYHSHIASFDWFNNDNLLYSNEQGLYSVTDSGDTHELLTPIPNQQVAFTQAASDVSKLLLSFQSTSSIGQVIDNTVGDKALPVTLSNGSDSEFAISPDATRMAFASTREGHKALWLRHNNQLNSVKGSNFNDIYDLTWSKNSQLLAASVKRNNQYGVMFYDISSQKLTVHWRDTSPLHVIGWDSNSHIWYSKLIGSNWALTQFDPIKKTIIEHPKKRVYQARFTPNKQHLIYIDAHKQTLWKWDLKNNLKEISIPHNMKLDRNWDVDSRGVYYIGSNGQLNYYNINNEIDKEIVRRIGAFSPKYRPQSRLYGFVGTHEVITQSDFWLSDLAFNDP